MTTSRRSILRRLALATSATCLGILVAAGMLGLAEWAARTFALVPPTVALFDHPDLRIRGRAYVEPDAELGFRLRPGFTSPTINVDDRGFRRGGVDPGTSEATILALGDSTTFGWALKDEESYPARLDAWLRSSDAKRRLRVVNGGVPSYTSAQVSLYQRRLLPRLSPDVVIVSVLWNDVWFSLVRHWFPEILLLAQPAPWRAYLNQHSALYRWLAYPPDANERRRDVPNERARDHYLATIGDIIDDAQNAGARIVLLQPPMAEDMIPGQGVDPMLQNTISKPALVGRAKEWAELASGLARARGATVVGHSLAVGQPASSKLFGDFIHPNAEGYNVMVAEIGPEIRAVINEVLVAKNRAGN